MKSMVVWCLAVGMSVSAVSGVFAADDAAKEKGKKKAQAGAQAFNLPKEVELTADQQEKLMALKKEYGPKLAEVQKKIDAVLTKDQKMARKDAMAKVKSDNLKGKERQAAIEEALNLTEDQKAQMKTLQMEQREITAKVRGEIAGFLTEEQKAKVPNLQPKTKTKKKKDKNA